MINISEAALTKFKDILEKEGVQDSALRLAIRGRARGSFLYTMGFVPVEDKSVDDIVVGATGLQILVDPASAENLTGASLDYVEEEDGAGFKIDNPNPLWKDPTSMAVQEVLDAHINPGIAMHGGFVNLIEVKDGVAYVTMGGGCQGCSHANTTISDGVEVMIREAVPEITKVVDATHHASGSNPYYK
jgi:Fe/S biogenesis protein NfuA